MEQRFFGNSSAGLEAYLYTLENKNGLRARVSNFAATLVEMWVPDCKGVFKDVTLGFADVARYESDDNQYFGCTTGRCANRIARGRFCLNGKEYVLAVNNGPNHLHGGGKRALSRVIWDTSFAEKQNSSISFTYISADGEEGYPGQVSINVSYTLTDDNELKIAYAAQSDAATVLNLTNHAYWNLGGHGSKSILNHELQIFADEYTEIDQFMIPSGKFLRVQGSALDFTSPRRIAERLSEVAALHTKGYDHNFVISGKIGALRPAALLRDPETGRTMEVFSTEPGLQLYTGNFLKNQLGKSGCIYAPHSALCLEAQGFPDAINHPHFPSVVLQPGQEYSQVTMHRFGY